MPADTIERAEARPATSSSGDGPLSMGSAEMRSLFEGSSTTLASSTADRKGDGAVASLEVDAASLYYDSFFSPTATAGTFRPPKAEVSLAADRSSERSEPVGRGVSGNNSYNVEPGDTLETISRTRLGEGATERERKAFVQAVREINQIGKDGEPKPGDSLKLPNRNDAGNFVYQAPNFKLTSFLSGALFTEVNGIQTSISPDRTRITVKEGTRSMVTDTVAGTTTLTDTSTPGIKSIRKSDGTSEHLVKDATGESITTSDANGHFLSFRRELPESNLKMTRTPDGKGGFVDAHKGARPEQDFKLSESAGGDLEVTDASGDKPQTFLKDASLTESRSELLALAAQRISDPLLLSKFKADMVRFESRAAEANLPPTEIKDTYSSLARILNAGSDAKIPQDQRIILAQQIIGQVARPSLVDQGSQVTCGAAALENIVFSTHPGGAANMLAEVALTGQFKATDGTLIKFPESNLKQFGDSQGILPSGHTADRSYASQLFQIAAINSFMQSRGDKVYTQLPSLMGKGAMMSTREAMIDKNGITSKFPGMLEPEIGKAYEQITGAKRETLILGNTVARPDHAADLVGFDNQDALVLKLEELRKSGNLPIIAMVHTSHEPFMTDAGSGVQKNSWHAVALSGFDPATGMVKIDNQWGTKSDKTISVAELFRASTGPRK